MSGQTIIAIVGRDLSKMAGVMGRLFSALDSIPLSLVSSGSADINLTIAVPGDRADEALRRIHEAVFESSDV